jgi:structural maintenance of chromosome 2
MYILDEVDAALDLSHTQNIGRLIKTRFKGSQFIVVSLKDGMFQNANRIFRTRFSEGTSVVQGPYFPKRSFLLLCGQEGLLLTFYSSHKCRL